MKAKAKTYDTEFKKNSVRLFFQSDKNPSQRQFARDLGVPDRTFRDWLDKYREEYEPEPITSSDREKKLEQKLALREMELDLLKKTIAIFSKDRI